jgi:transposase-like protein
MNQTALATRPRFDDTFRREAVNHWRASGKPAQTIAEELGIRCYLLYAWKKRFSAGAAQIKSAPAAQPATLAEAQVRLESAEREIRHLREQRDILKKTLGIISEVPPSVTNGSTR